MPSNALSYSKRLRAEPLIFVLLGPGGAGKGTVAARLVDLDSKLWLSRSWTTRAPRPGEVESGAYVFVDKQTFENEIEANGFLEWAEFMGNLYGTPLPPQGLNSDVLLEIEVQGAKRVLEKFPDATLILLLPPSLDEQAMRLSIRGDSEEKIRMRVDKGIEEVREARCLGVFEVVNYRVDQTVSEVADIVDHVRAASGRTT